MNALLNWYAANGRSGLPWRRTRDPYCVLVSEFMLQQTQVDRVIPKYEAFIGRFPTLEVLAAARVSDVVKMWKGLGYNSRAVRLHRLAREVLDRFGGAVPSDPHVLASLPGIGAYTQAAVRAFAFNEDTAAMDTNIRRIVHRLLYGIEYPPAAAPALLDAQAQALVPQGGGHDWNSAMMDLGSQICTARAPKCLLCPLRAECEAAPVDAAELDRLRELYARPRSPQERIPFEQSTRFTRGRIIDALRDLPDGQAISLLDLHAGLQVAVQRDAGDFTAIVLALANDGLVHLDGQKVALAR